MVKKSIELNEIMEYSDPELNASDNLNKGSALKSDPKKLKLIRAKKTKMAKSRITKSRITKPRITKQENSSARKPIKRIIRKKKGGDIEIEEVESGFNLLPDEIKSIEELGYDAIDIRSALSNISGRRVIDINNILNDKSKSQHDRIENLVDYLNNIALARERKEDIQVELSQSLSTKKSDIIQPDFRYRLFEEGFNISEMKPEITKSLSADDALGMEAYDRSIFEGNDPLGLNDIKDINDPFINEESIFEESKNDKDIEDITTTKTESFSREYPEEKHKEFKEYMKEFRPVDSKEIVSKLNSILDTEEQLLFPDKKKGFSKSQDEKLILKNNDELKKEFRKRAMDIIKSKSKNKNISLKNLTDNQKIYYTSLVHDQYEDYFNKLNKNKNALIDNLIDMYNFEERTPNDLKDVLSEYYDDIEIERLIKDENKNISELIAESIYGDNIKKSDVRNFLKKLDKYRASYTGKSKSLVLANMEQFKKHLYDIENIERQRKLISKKAPKQSIEKLDEITKNIIELEKEISLIERAPSKLNTKKKRKEFEEKKQKLENLKDDYNELERFTKNLYKETSDKSSILYDITKSISDKDIETIYSVITGEYIQINNLNETQKNLLRRSILNTHLGIKHSGNKYIDNLTLKLMSMNTGEKQKKIEKILNKKKISEYVYKYSSEPPIAKRFEEKKLEPSQINKFNYDFTTSNISSSDQFLSSKEALKLKKVRKGIVSNAKQNMDNNNRVIKPIVESLTYNNEKNLIPNKSKKLAFVDKLNDKPELLKNINKKQTLSYKKNTQRAIKDAVIQIETLQQASKNKPFLSSEFDDKPRMRHNKRITLKLPSVSIDYKQPKITNHKYPLGDILTAEDQHKYNVVMSNLKKLGELIPTVINKEKSLKKAAEKKRILKDIEQLVKLKNYYLHAQELFTVKYN